MDNPQILYEHAVDRLLEVYKLEDFIREMYISRIPCDKTGELLIRFRKDDCYVYTLSIVDAKNMRTGDPEVCLLKPSMYHSSLFPLSVGDSRVDITIKSLTSYEISDETKCMQSFREWCKRKLLNLYTNSSWFDSSVLRYIYPVRSNQVLYCSSTRIIEIDDDTFRHPTTFTYYVRDYHVPSNTVTIAIIHFSDSILSLGAQFKIFKTLNVDTSLLQTYVDSNNLNQFGRQIRCVLPEFGLVL